MSTATYEKLASLATGAQAKVLALVGENKRVLELGCSSGYMSLAMFKAGCNVTGLDNDHKALDIARSRGVDARYADLNDPATALLTIEPGAFDVIVAADVLEHLVWPETTLSALKRYLASGGYIVASIPNVAHGALRLALLAGTWPVQSVGLLDETHLRFYTGDGIVRLFGDAGWSINAMYRIDRPLDMTEIPWPQSNPSFRAIADQLVKDPDALTYQYIVQATVG